MKSTRSGAVAPLAHGEVTSRFQNGSVGLAHFSVKVLWAHLISHLAVPTAVSNPPSNHWLVWKAPMTSVHLKLWEPPPSPASPVAGRPPPPLSTLSPPSTIAAAS